MYNWKDWRSKSNGNLTPKGGRRRAVCSWRKVERKSIRGRDRRLPYQVGRLKNEGHNSFLRGGSKYLWSLLGIDHIKSPLMLYRKSIYLSIHLS